MNRITFGYCCSVSGLVVIAVLGVTLQCRADIKPDQTLSIPSSVVRNADGYQIGAGTRPKEGPNLFHSFSDFTIEDGQSAYFDNPNGVERIFSRVTGTNRSRILGTLGVSGGNADLFFINPNGITFGRNARLDIGGSFVATTGDRILFDNGLEFSAVTPNDPALLTLNSPVGLQFGQNPQSIRNFSLAPPINVLTGEEIDREGGRNNGGLQVPPGNTLALVGGNVRLPGGEILVRGGRIEIGSVGENSQVELRSAVRGWRLRYDSVEKYAEIELNNIAIIDGSGTVNGEVGGSPIQLQGGIIQILGESEIFTSSASSVSNIKIGASENIYIADLSFIGHEVLGSATGEGHRIRIQTGQLVLDSESIISTDVLGSGQGADLVINASALVKIDDLSSLAVGVATGAEIDLTENITGNGGNLKLSTQRLQIQRGGQVLADTFSAGNAGTINLLATESIELIGRQPRNLALASIISAQAEEGTTGNGGLITVETSRLILREGAQIITSTRSGNRAGDLTINASESVVLNGAIPNRRTDNFSGLVVSAESTATGDAGTLTLTTPLLIIEDGGEISIENLGSGQQGGNAVLNVEQLILRDNGQIDATTEGIGGGANIDIDQVNLVLLTGESEISAQATGAANGGNLNIDAANGFVVAAFDNNDLVANSDAGKGGNINIETLGIFGLEERNPLSPLSDINVSSELGTDGIISISSPELNPIEGVFELPGTPVDVAGLVDQTLCQSTQGSEFLITGRGGLLPSPREQFRSEDLWEDWRLMDIAEAPSELPSLLSTVSPAEQTDEGSEEAIAPAPQRLNVQSPRSDRTIDLSMGYAIANPSYEQTPPLLEAQGWRTTPNGDIILVADATSTNVSVDVPSILPSSTCQTHIPAHGESAS